MYVENLEMDNSLKWVLFIKVNGEINICYSSDGRSVLEKLCPRSWIPPEGAVFPIRTDLGW